MRTDKMAPSDTKEYNARMAEYFEDVNEQRFPSEYRSDKEKVLRMVVATSAAIVAVAVTHIAFTHFVSPAYEAMQRDPVEVVD